ncbi:DUF1707 SHOCT-like domain-containing protein [Corynebacterium tapiri]|uniref:DUF1707 domain-containing protein n=1 Tax=Corynebacterium tapiri TaxID=1448266 RepID=A0A5C4U158_9CORY|nr:DUF1707 domain-containing protein [Corynebacterium tapiri]TNL94864.1 DUF1707 domain-containing protein [Corynebacterium tapiri]
MSTERIGNPERNAALDSLGEYFADGYLDVDEFDQRTMHAAQARTRTDLEALFNDLPARNVPAQRDEPSLAVHESAEDELDAVMRKNRIVQSADAAIWGVAVLVFFLGLFVFEWDYFWAAFPVAGVASAGVRGVVSLSDEEEELAGKLEEDAKKERAKRLRKAAERRRELGK